MFRMTGYGNTHFFVRKKVFGLNRMFGMLFRMNWLVFWVCLLLDQPLILYYICPLHTTFFLFCYATWGIGHSLNEQRGVKELKLAISGLALFLLFDVFPISVFDAIWSPLHWLLSMHSTLYEWHFRTHLDHYATWMGMVFAVYYEAVSKVLTVHLEGRTLIKWGVAAVVSGAIGVWYHFVFLHDKYRYNEMHPYWESIPIFGYIALRNLYSPLRPYYR